MQPLTLSAAAFQYSIAPDDPYGAQSQFALLVSVLDSSGNQVEQLTQENFHCFIHFVGHGFLATPGISQFVAFGKGMYRLIVLGGGLESDEPTPPLQVAVIVEQVEIVQEGPRQVEVEVIARGQAVMNAVHGDNYEV